MARFFSVIPMIGTTNDSGAATVKSSRAVNGLLWSVVEDKGSLVNGVDLTLSVVNSEMSMTLLTLTDANTDQAQFFPRASSCGATGTSNSDNGEQIPVVGVLQCVIAQGGDAKRGGLYALVME